MVNTNTKTTNVVNVNQPNQLPSGLGIAGSVAWAKSKGLSSFSQLVIGKGTCPNYKTQVLANVKRFYLIMQWLGKLWRNTTPKPKG